MTHDFAPKLARILTEYCQPVNQGDYAIIFGSTATVPMVEALLEAIWKRGGNTTSFIGLPNTAEIFFNCATDEQFDFQDPAVMVATEKADILFSVRASTNSKQLALVDPARLARRQQGQRPWVELYFRRIQEDALRFNIFGWPTEAAAQDAEMGLLAYTQFIYTACGLDQNDPIAFWKEFRDRQERLIEWLKGKQHAEVHGPGIDLSFDFGGRTWISCHGTRNFPDGEIFTCPIEDSVNGHVEFSFPTMYGGRESSGVALVFKNGAVVESSADKGNDYLQSQLNMDEGARRLGEFAVGTNRGIQKFTREILFDEKIGGTIHMALGENPNKDTGGVNKSAIHWDMVHNMKDGGEIHIDGTLFYRSGEFMV
ncbi:MAG: aminopeptidase [Chloroflexi bacterium]|nr:aminopeptidase [Chloroflexota bacterium]